MTAARTSRLALEVVSRLAPVDSGPPAIGADLQQQTGALVLASGGAVAPALPPRAALLGAIVIEVLTARRAPSCHCVIVPQAPPPKYLMRRPARFR